MEFRHVVGFCLLLIGIGIIPLFFVFQSDGELFNPQFLYCLGCGGLLFLFLGLIILSKSR